MRNELKTHRKLPKEQGNSPLSLVSNSPQSHSRGLLGAREDQISEVTPLQILQGELETNLLGFEVQEGFC